MNATDEQPRAPTHNDLNDVMESANTDSSATATVAREVTAWHERLPMEKIVPGKFRREGDDDVDDLVESLENTPLLHAIAVRPVPGKDKFEIVCGHRRYRALLQLGAPEVDALVIANLDDAAAERLMLEENIRRRGMADEAAALKKLHDLYSVSAPVRRGGDHRSAEYRAQQA